MEKKTIENMNYNYELYTQIENLKIIREWINDTDILLRRIEKIDINNIQKQIEEAYQNGYKACMQENDFDSPCTSCETYQRGLEDGCNKAWEAARKITLYRDEGGTSILDLTEIFDCFTIQQVFRKYTVFEVIEKLKAYEEKQKAENKIKVRDEVVWTEDENVVIVVTSIYTVDDVEWCDGVCKDGKVYSILTKNARKTGRRFDIDKILEEMKK